MHDKLVGIVEDAISEVNKMLMGGLRMDENNEFPEPEWLEEHRAQRVLIELSIGLQKNVFRI